MESSQVIIVIINQVDCEAFHFSAVYGNPKSRNREVLWRTLDDVSTHNGNTWHEPNERRSMNIAGFNSRNGNRCFFLRIVSGSTLREESSPVFVSVLPKNN